MLKLADLTQRPDFSAGPLHVSPARRLVEGPAGRVQVEPIVMKVFLLLIDAAGSVVTRDELFGHAWGGVFVGDDSLNRAIARVRKIASRTAPGLFEVETIPRTGYRLTGEIVNAGKSVAPDSQASRSPAISRRTLMVSAGAAGLAAVGATIWTIRSREERRFDDLVERGESGLEYGDGSHEPADLLRQAVDIRPGDGRAQGLLALALMWTADNARKESLYGTVDAVENAAAASLRLHPGDANAAVALIMLQQSTLDLASTERRVRRVLAGAPDNIFAMRLLWNLLQSAGRSHDALEMVQRAIALKPLAAGNNYPLGQLLWIVGRTAEADRIIDRAMQYWPAHRYVRFARFTIFAFTGRPRAAAAMLDSDDTRPQNFSPASVALWRTSLAALDQPSSANIAAARDANLHGVKSNPKLAGQAVLALSALGELDAAFEIANDLLVFSNSGAGSRPAAGNTRTARSTAWPFTPWLFTPPAASLRADPRFAALCDGIGLTAYWRQSGIKPDYQQA